MKRKFSLSKDSIATLKTGGQPLHVVKVTKARKSSLDASVRVTKKRTNEIAHFFGDRLPARPQRQVRLSKYMN